MKLKGFVCHDITMRFYNTSSLFSDFTCSGMDFNVDEAIKSLLGNSIGQQMQKDIPVDALPDEEGNFYHSVVSVLHFFLFVFTLLAGIWLALK